MPSEGVIMKTVNSFKAKNDPLIRQVCVCVCVGRGGAVWDEDLLP